MKLIDEKTALIDTGRIEDFLEWFEKDVIQYQPNGLQKSIMGGGIIFGVIGATFNGLLSYDFGKRFAGEAAAVLLGILAGIPLICLNAKQCKVLAENIAKIESAEGKKIADRRICGTKAAKGIGIVLAIVPGSMMATTMTYVSFVEYSRISKVLSHIINVPTFISNAAVYSWVINTIGANLYSSICKLFLKRKIKENQLNAKFKRLALLDQIDQAMGSIKKLSKAEIEQKMQFLFSKTDNLHETHHDLLLRKIKELVSVNNNQKNDSCLQPSTAFDVLGKVFGFCAAYVLLPAGKQAGTFLGELICDDPILTDVMANVVGYMSGLAGGCLMSFATSTSFTKLYSTLSNCKGKKQAKSCKEVLPSAILQSLFMLLSAVSVIPRIELTLNDSELPMAVNIFIIVSVFIAGFCKDYWGIDDFYNVLFSKDPSLVLIKALQDVKAKVETLSLSHVDSLYDEVAVKSEHLLNDVGVGAVTHSRNKSLFFNCCKNKDETRVGLSIQNNESMNTMPPSIILE